MCKNSISCEASHPKILADENTAMSVKKLNLTLSYFFSLKIPC